MFELVSWNPEDDLGFTDLIKHKRITLTVTPQCCRPYGTPASIQDDIMSQKKNGSNIICVGYRKLNKVTVKDQYSLPLRDDIFDRLNGSGVFFIFNLKAGIWKIGFDESSKEKTTFCHWPGRGVCFMSSTCCMAYLDDILIYSPSIEQHLVDLKERLHQIKCAGIKLNRDKCNFSVESIEYLDVKISKKWTISNWEIPKDTIDLRPFLGLCNTAQRFVPNLAHRAVLLNRLLCKNTLWSWSKECDTAFKDRKHCLSSSSLMRFPDIQKKSF
ncbi:hypothetical protein RF11_15918 [Thelohanellus kitauei]|uniref:Reverse transcriptase domain-containing protein n=1 Tax=Thelohanellus kitauei TaxID=669202 RepID=A0A0C2J7K3_THEKT|nr:hypothetical protein RF11_15918 [Thelohanellus kitauei]